MIYWLSYRILSSLLWPKFLYGTVFMKHPHTRISPYRPVLFIIGGPGPIEWPNLDQKRWLSEEKSWSPLLISGFWQYNIAYDISFCCKLYHLSQWMQEKVIRGHWGDLFFMFKYVKIWQWTWCFCIFILTWWLFFKAFDDFLLSKSDFCD